MGQLLRSGQVGNIQLNQLQEQRVQVLSRWEETGMLEGLDKSKKGNIAQLLENEAGYLLREANNETSNIAGFDIIAFPIVRRVFSRLLANEIVSVQPLNLPTGLLFYLDNQVQAGPSGSFTSVYDAHYNNGGHYYSFGAATEVTGATVSTGTSTVLLPYTGQEKSLASLVIKDANQKEVRYSILPQTWTEDLLRTNSTLAIVHASATTDGSSLGATLHGEWKEYADLEANSAMTEVKLVVTSTTVDVTSRKMKAHWTPELAQDLAAYHSIDAEAELTALLSEELAAEIDREIINDIILVAPYRTVWSYDRTASVMRQDGSTLAADPASGYITQKEWNQTLLTQINKVSAQIHKATLRGGANWIVCSTEVGSVIDDIEKFHGVNDADATEFNMGLENMGTLGTRYKVYKDPYLPSNICLIGHKGSNFLDTGYVYAPYIPFQLTPVVNDPNDFTPRKGIMTRYAKKVVNNKYYGLVDVIFPDTYAIVNG